MSPLRVPRIACSLLWVFVGTFPWVGCATKGDLEQLKQEIQASSSRVEALKGETRTGLEKTRKQIEDRDQELADRLKALEAALTKLSETVKEQQALLAQDLARNETLSKENAELSAAVRGVNRAFLEFLRSGERQLAEELGRFQGLLKEMAGEEKSPPSKKSDR